MGRDWESHLFFEHRPLTAGFVASLLLRLRDSGLTLGAPEGETFPALAGFRIGAGSIEVAADDIDALLRTKEPPVGAGYGVLPLRVTRAGLPGDHTAFLTFQRPDPLTGLDGATLVLDGALFGADAGATLDAAFDWLALLGEALVAVYAWADWETASFLVAAPSRRDVRAGAIPRLMRFNLAGPALRPALEPAATAAPRRREIAGGALVFERSGADAIST